MTVRVFQVLVIAWAENTEPTTFTIKHDNETPFHIIFEHLWPYLLQSQQQLLRSIGCDELLPDTGQAAAGDSAFTGVRKVNVVASRTVCYLLHIRKRFTVV